MPEQKKTNRAMRRKQKREGASSTPSLKASLRQPAPRQARQTRSSRPMGRASRFRGK